MIVAPNGRPVSTAPPKEATVDEFVELIARIHAAHSRMGSANPNKRLLTDCAKWLDRLGGRVLQLQQQNAQLRERIGGDARIVSPGGVHGQA